MRARRWIGLGITGAVALSIGLYLPATLTPAPPAIAAEVDAQQPQPGPPVSYRFPRGLSAVGLADSTDLLGGNRSDERHPIASITKIVTAFVVLEKYPLAADEEGPSITMSRADVALYDEYYLKGAKIAPVKAGAVFTERDLLKLGLIDSAANYVESLTRWAFGTDARFASAARTWLDAHGLPGITIADPIGLDPRNSATAADVVALGRLAMADPVIRDLVGTTDAEVPWVGRIDNTNFLLGVDGIEGIKTGTLLEYGTNLLFSTRLSSPGGELSLIGVVLGSSPDAISADVNDLFSSIRENYHPITLTAANRVFGSYSTPWGESADAISSSSADVTVLGDTPIEMTVDIDPIATGKAGDRVGEVLYRVGTQVKTVQLVLSRDIEAPDGWWRIGHPGLIFGDW